MNDDRGIGLIFKMQHETNARAERGQQPLLWKNIGDGLARALAKNRVQPFGKEDVAEDE